uniref:Uncharacterized protein n=2 Tax=Caenorhabditis japonica TaxID=281687 RepID=A0A8R1I610_CAEJA
MYKSNVIILEPPQLVLSSMQSRILFYIFLLWIGSSIANCYQRHAIYNAKQNSVESSDITEFQTTKPTYTKTDVEIYHVDNSKETRTCTLTVEGAPGDRCRGYEYVVKVTTKRRNGSSSSSRQCSATSCGNQQNNKAANCPTIFPQYQELCDFSQQ